MRISAASLALRFANNGPDFRMANALADFLQRPTTTRKVTEYETVFDDFISFAGGDRVENRFEVPRDTENADYHLLTDKYEIIIELKRMNAYRKEESVEAYFSRLLGQGRILKSQQAAPNQVRIDPDSLSQRERRRFYTKFRPSLAAHLDKAARQLKATNGFISRLTPERPRYFGVVLMNSNDFNVSTDLLYRLAEWHAKEKWGRGFYSCLDFVTCLSMDLLQESYRPLHCRHIARDLELPFLGEAVRHLFVHWVASAALLVMQIRPSSRKRVKDGQRFSM